MSTGRIYLVSACASGEEFVAAFRRYADRNGLFIPIAEPIAVGRRGRFALTLTDGGVMLEGDGEVISSARTPSVLHGRVGMTIRFAELDDASKTVIVELEKARLAMKPPAPSVPPRPAQVPAEPRAKPPAPSGRIDVHNALAECVVIGDVESLAISDPKAPPKAGPRFVVPTIPPVVGARPKSPTAPPILPPPVLRPKSPSTPPAVPPPRPKPTEPPEVAVVQIADDAAPVGALSSTMAAARPYEDPPAIGQGSTSGSLQPGAFSATMPAIDLASLKPPPEQPPPIFEITPEPIAPRVAERRGDTLPPPPDEPTSPFVPLASMTTPPPIPATAQIMDAVVPDVTPQMMEVVAPIPTPTEMAVVPPPPTTTAVMPAFTPARAQATPPPIPIVQAPIVAVRSTPAPIIEDEPTDLTEIPVEQILDDPPKLPRKTVMGVAVGPTDATVLPAVTEPGLDNVRDTNLMTAQEQAALAAAGSSPTIEEATPSGDWTMTPGADGPTIMPREPDEEPETKKPKVPTGDWLIAVEPSAPDGWSEPSKPAVVVSQLPIDRAELVGIEVVAPAPVPVTSRRAAQPTPAEPRPRLEPILDEPKVQIDPTLIEPLTPMPALLDEPPRSPYPTGASQSYPLVAGSASASFPQYDGGMRMVGSAGSAHELPMMPPPPPPNAIFTPLPGSMVSATGPNAVYSGMAPGMAPPIPGLPPRGVTDAGTGFFRESGEIAQFVGDSTSMVNVNNRRRRIIVIVASAAVAVIAGVVLLIVFGDDLFGSSKHDDHEATPGTGEIKTAPPNGSAGTSAPDDRAKLVGIDAAVAVVPPPPPDAAVAAAPQCFIEVTSAPPGAEIVQDKVVIGTTPSKLPLPCGDEVKLTVRKARLASITRTIVPTEEGAKLKVNLTKLVFSVKVSTQPAGATVTVNGKSLGVTPTNIKLPAFEVSTLTLSKEGYTSETQKITPKQNNQAIQAQLKKKRR